MFTRSVCRRKRHSLTLRDLVWVGALTLSKAIIVVVARNPRRLWMGLHGRRRKDTECVTHNVTNVSITVASAASRCAKLEADEFLGHKILYAETIAYCHRLRCLL